MSDEGPHDFSNRALCELLGKPDHLRDFVGNAVPELANGFDFERMTFAPQEFLVGNSRLRKPDVLVEVPYRTGESERTAIVCVLIEHQTQTDWRIPLKIYLYSAFYWEWQWRKWEAAPTPKSQFTLTPILPIVLHTGKRPWNSARQLRELIGPPGEFHSFTPDWEPVFWELASHSTEELINGPAAFVSALAIYKAEDAELEEAGKLFASIFKQIGALRDSSRVRWEDLLKFLLGWAQNRRPKDERQAWHDLAINLEANEERRREIDRMSTTIAQSIYQEGRQEGALSQARASLINQGRKKFGSANDATLQRLNAISDIDRLNRMSEELLDKATWDGLLSVE